MKTFLVIDGGGRRTVTARKVRRSLSLDEMRHTVGAAFPEPDITIVSPLAPVPPLARLARVSVWVSDNAEGKGRIDDKVYSWLIAFLPPAEGSRPIRVSSELGISLLPGSDLILRQHEYTTLISPPHHEWQMAVMYTTRQDGKTYWQVSVADVDGCITSRTALTLSHETPALLESAIWNLLGPRR